MKECHHVANIVEGNSFSNETSIPSKTTTTELLWLWSRLWSMLQIIMLRCSRFAAVCFAAVGVAVLVCGRPLQSKQSWVQA